MSNLFSPPHAEIVKYTFPSRQKAGKVKISEVDVFWYDGGILPDRPKERVPGAMMGDADGGIIFVGKKGKIMTGCYGMNATLLPVENMKDFKKPSPWIPRVAGDNGDI